MNPPRAIHVPPLMRRRVWAGIFDFFLRGFLISGIALGIGFLYEAARTKPAPKKRPPAPLFLEAPESHP